jgi:signal transduction histidine kinase
MPNQPDDWLDRSVLEVIPLVRRRAPQAAKAILREIRRTQTGYEPSAEGNYDVAPYSIHWLSLPVLSGAAPLGRLIVMRDVTEERSVAAMRDDLTNTMVHDLRNPLTVIQSSLDLLTMDSPDKASESQQQVLEVMQHGTQRMLNLVTAILDVNRLESGQMPLDREPVLLSMLVADVLAMQTVLADEKQLQLINEVATDLPPVSIDVELVRRVFQNVIGNAIKFTPPDGTVRVSAQIDPSDERMLAACVCDTGPGVPLDLQPRLFQKFVTGRSFGRGTGLGLAFCRLVLEAHGGRIWLENGAGTGAVFKFTLPIVE